LAISIDKYIFFLAIVVHIFFRNHGNLAVQGASMAMGEGLSQI